MKSLDLKQDKRDILGKTKKPSFDRIKKSQESVKSGKNYMKGFNSANERSKKHRPQPLCLVLKRNSPKKIFSRFLCKKTMGMSICDSETLVNRFL